MITEKRQDAAICHAQEFQYQLLDRLASDCRYYLGFGNRSEKYLWAGNVPDQIAEMRELYDQLVEKPEWITPEDIDDFERQMLQPEVGATAPSTRMSC